MTVIACPHCGTRYRLAAETLGPGGREVQCANCARSWRADPGTRLAPSEEDRDRLFDEATEQDLDAAFVAEERAARAEEEVPAAPAPLAAAAPAPRLDPKLKRKRDRAFARRQHSLLARLPLARLRRVARVVALGLLLALIGGGIGFRTEIVRLLPDLAGTYEALGLKVNTVGLDFSDAHTLLALRGGSSVMQVGARIHSVARRTVAVPPVVVTLLDGAGNALYEWSVRPDTAELEPGESVLFESRLASPPAEARRVRLTFGGHGKSETRTAAAVAERVPAH